MAWNPGADDRPLAIALMGPTASGKTALALDWASRLDSDVVSVDSALVYRGLDIGSAKPDRETLARIRHHLVDIRDPHQPYSAAEFANDALAAMQALADKGRVPVLAGGTGLYFRSLLHGFSAMPGADPDTRAQRVLKLVLAPADRAVLHARIERRLDAMLDAGFLEEIRRLRSDQRLHAELPAIRAVGYRQGWAYLDGEGDLAGFRERATAATRQLAKRQLTWLRGEADARWLDPEADAAELEAAFRLFTARS